jgi:hypothetical protein
MRATCEPISPAPITSVVIPSYSFVLASLLRGDKAEGKQSSATMQIA